MFDDIVLHLEWYATTVPQYWKCKWESFRKFKSYIITSNCLYNGLRGKKVFAVIHINFFSPPTFGVKNSNAFSKALGWNTMCCTIEKKNKIDNFLSDMHDHYNLTKILTDYSHDTRNYCKHCRHHLAAQGYIVSIAQDLTILQF